MKNAMQLKAKLKKIAESNKISAQAVLQNYILERFLERISISPYKQNFIIKGGFLLSAIFGIQSRTTMDMDTTIKGFPVNNQKIREVIEDICKININDNIDFILKDIEEIRERDNYKGFRVSLGALYSPMNIPLKIDISTGEKITPREIEFFYPKMFSDNKISILAYNLETILSEKIETIISRGDLNTRLRDFYDVYIIQKFQWRNINIDVLSSAIKRTFSKRNTYDLLEKRQEILESIKNNKDIYQYWVNYQKKYYYAHGIPFEELFDSINIIFSELYT